MGVIREYATVRIARLLEPARRYSGTEGVARPPRIGDVATVCHDYSPGSEKGIVAVELVNDDGETVWLADFSREELETVSSAGAP